MIVLGKKKGRSDDPSDPHLHKREVTFTDPIGGGRRGSSSTLLSARQSLLRQRIPKISKCGIGAHGASKPEFLETGLAGHWPRHDGAAAPHVADLELPEAR